MSRRNANIEELLKKYFAEEEEESSSEEDFALQESGGDTQSYMSVQALRSMMEHSEMLLEMIDENTPLPDWVEFKLAQSSGMLTTVLEYMKHGGHSKKGTGNGFRKDVIAQLRDYFQDKGNLKDSDTILFLNDTDDLFEFTIKNDGYVKCLVNHHLFVDDYFNNSRQAMKEIKKQIHDHVYGF